MIKRFLLSLPLSGLATGAVFGLMMGLTATEWQPADTSRDLKYEINPEVIEIDPPIRIKNPPQLDAVDIPPASPIVETATPLLPQEPIVPDPKPVDPPKPNYDIITTAIGGGITENCLLVRVPPTMPPRAERSGHCIVEYDLTDDGQPFNVRALSCSQSLFGTASTRAVQGWKYCPAASQPGAQRKDLRTRITFTLTDERGRVIPE